MLRAVLGIALLVVLWLPGAAASGVGGDCAVAGGEERLDGEEAALLGLLNGYRAGHGLGVLVVSEGLSRSAAWMSRDMGVKERFAHTDSLGRDPVERARDCGYGYAAGENLAAGGGWDTGREAFDAWVASPGHNANMLLAMYVMVGVARVYVEGSPWGWYWALELGVGDDGSGEALFPVARLALIARE